MRMMWWKKQPEPTPQEMAEMKALCSSVASKLTAAGHPARPFTKDSHEVPRDIDDRIRALKLYNELLGHHAPGEGIEPDVKPLLWNFLSHMGYTPTSDLFDHITDGDLVEVYNHNATQLFRSLNFFDLSSLSVEDLIFMNWKRDTKRELSVFMMLLGISIRFAMGQVHRTYDCSSIPPHVVTERLGNKHIIEGHVKCVSPLKRAGKCEAIVTVSRARLIGRA